MKNNEKIVNGLIFGKFAPLTTGHEFFIDKAVEQCDHLYLFLSFDQKFVDQQPKWIQPKLSLEYRLLDLKNTYGGHPNVTVSYVDESSIPGYPEGCAQYEQLIRKALPEGVELHKAFSSEREYDAYFSAHFPECEHVVIDADRDSVPISATKVRNDPFGNFDHISYEAQPRFVKKVAIVGVESTGKSTLTEALAKHYHTKFVPEVGRMICENSFYGSEMLMTRRDYLNICFQHRIAEDKVAALCAVGVMFSDTTNLITYFSALCADKTDLRDDLFHSLCAEEADYYDLILYLTPEVPWVEEPLRLQNTPEKRKETNQLLAHMVISHYTKSPVIYISGDDYDKRTAQAIAAVDKLLKGN